MKNQEIKNQGEGQQKKGKNPGFEHGRNEERTPDFNRTTNVEKSSEEMQVDDEIRNPNFSKEEEYKGGSEKSRKTA